METKTTLRGFREMAGLTRSALAKLAGISTSSIFLYESGGRVKPYVLTHLLEICRHQIRQNAMAAGILSEDPKGWTGHFGG